MIGAIGTNECSEQRGLILKVNNASLIQGNAEVEEIVCEFKDGGPKAFFRFGPKPYVSHRWVYKQFSYSDCKEFGVDFGGWLCS